MLLDPQGYVPVEQAMRTTIARNAFRSQPRRTRRPRRTVRIDWDRLRHPVATPR